MNSDKLEVVRGSGNVFRDLGHKNADAEQLRVSWQPKSSRPSTGNTCPCARRMIEPVLRLPTSRVSATRTSGGSPWIASWQSSTCSGRAWK